MGFLNVVVAENGQNWSNFMFWNYEILKLAQISMIKYLNFVCPSQ